VSANRTPWFAVGRPGRYGLRCCACGADVDLGFPSADHHPAVCPVCGIDSLFLSWRGVLVQVVPPAAPPEVERTIRWAQENLDELEFITVLTSLAQIAEAIPVAAEVVRKE
jgi:hypothetical protein